MKTSEPLFPFSHPKILQTAMPLGGIGTGTICFNGYGGLQDFSIRHYPHITARPDTHGTEDAAFALLHVEGEEPITRLVEGPLPPEKVYDQGLQAQGYRHGGHEGLARFRKCVFTSGYPFGRVALSHPKIPLDVAVTAWNPFIPLDDVNSGIPAAILEYTFHNKTRKTVKFRFSYHLSHFARGERGSFDGTRNKVIPGKGIFFHNTEPENAQRYGSASLTVIGKRPKIKAMWVRGGWFDPVSALWKEAEEGRFATNDGTQGAGHKGRNGGSILIEGELKPNEKTTVPIVITWYFPNCYVTAAQPSSDCCAGSDCCPSPKWKPFYTTRWKDAAEVAEYVHRQYRSLRNRTIAFQHALLQGTQPLEVLDAVSANLGIIKSPTVLRQANGNLWGWEGCFTDSGCCPGSCTHVWNYAQAFPHLFPQLERTLREQELVRSMDEEGHISFRSALPDGPAHHNFHAAADGQLGGLMKLYRDWQISGDTEWMQHLYPRAKQSIEYCIRTWDPDERGALFEPHHNTYDIEFWGPDGMCTTIYVGALTAMNLMAEALGETEDAERYGSLAKRGAEFMNMELFNGDYLEQKVDYKNLRDKSFLEIIAGRRQTNESAEMLRILKKEGPKYQYGSGCISDGVIGEWMARIYGMETPTDKKMIRKNLRSIFTYNFKRTLADHSNCQRPGYAIGDEAGLLLCSWPKGGKPTLPFVYSDEVWPGIEYQVATHMIAEGLVKEGLTIVKALRKRFDGAVRNPWNEYECGSYYARSMASYALINTLAGFHYSAVEKSLRLAPRLEGREYRTFFSTATGFGTFKLSKTALIVEMVEGSLRIDRAIVEFDGKTYNLQPRTTAKAGKPLKLSLR
jgi:uncharacterized protein (DUF608 family)